MCIFAFDYRFGQRCSALLQSGRPFGVCLAGGHLHLSVRDSAVDTGRQRSRQESEWPGELPVPNQRRATTDTREEMVRTLLSGIDQVLIIVDLVKFTREKRECRPKALQSGPRFPFRDLFPSMANGWRSLETMKC